MEKSEYTCKLVERHCRGKILDLGCGSGFFSDYLQKKGFDVTGVDIDPENIKSAKKRNSKVRFILSDVTRLNLKKKYDTVLLFGVLEYLVNVNLTKFLSDIKNLLNKDGKILIQVPNANSLQRRIKTSLNHEPIEPLPHYDFNDKRIKDIIRNAGYEIVRFTSTKLWTFRKYRPYMPINSLATEFFVVAERRTKLK